MDTSNNNDLNHPPQTHETNSDENENGNEVIEDRNQFQSKERINSVKRSQITPFEFNQPETASVKSAKQDRTCSLFISILRGISKYRHLISFWLFGLCNNFAYVVMLSAAHDILHNETNNDINSNISRVNVTTTTTTTTASSMFNVNASDTSLQTSNSSSESNYLVCNTISTGAILLADIIPTLVVKLTFPFFLQQIPYSVKISLIVFFGALSFVLVAFAKQVWIAVLGVVSASIGAGLGEITFLSLTTFYHRDVVSSWSSGTGGAGIVGALIYAGFTSVGLTPRDSLLIMLIVPAIMLVIYFFVLPPFKNHTNNETDMERSEEQAGNIENTSKKQVKDTLSLREKFQLIPTLFKFMIPLSLVYFGEYFINQGLHELLYFKGEFLTPKEQYRWFQVDYQVGVFISRSSVNVFQMRKLWILPILQFVNMAVLILQVYFRFLPSFWLIVVIVLWEGLLGGAAYVNTFYRMTNELPSRIKEFCIGVSTVGDSIGISIAGSAAIPFHNHICNLKLKI